LTSPTEAARTALRRLSELGLPPTPDNFQRFYAEAGGEGSTAADAPAAPADPAVANSEAEVLMDAVRRFAEELVETTGSLAEDIGQHNADLLQTMAAAAPPPASLTPQVATLLSSVLSIASTIQSTVQASHAELMRAREEIDELRRDLKQSHEWLLQDPLTGMQNRRGMDATLFHEVARARRSVPHAGRLVITCGREAAVGERADGIHFARVPLEHAHARARRGVPHADRLVVRRSRIRRARRL
jgi:diguanylate cyclase